MYVRETRTAARQQAQRAMETTSPQFKISSSLVPWGSAALIWYRFRRQVSHGNSPHDELPFSRNVPWPFITSTRNTRHFVLFRRPVWLLTFSSLLVTTAALSSLSLPDYFQPSSYPNFRPHIINWLTQT